VNQLPINQVLCGDCLELIYGLPEKSIDLILTDPPYNIANKTKIAFQSGIPKSTKEAWGNDFKDSFSNYGMFIQELQKAFDYVLRKNGSILLFFSPSEFYNLKPFYDCFSYRNTLIFYKKNPAPHIRKNNYRSSFEPCLWFSRKKYNLNFISQKNMKNVFFGLSGGAVDKQTEHPTEKYGWMIQPLIERHSNQGDIILDPMCGSGSTLVYAKKMGRRYIGIDIEERWVALSKKRLTGTPVSLFQFTLPPKVREK